MNAPHDVAAGFRAACLTPECHPRGLHFVDSCRDCLAALVASAVNAPWAVLTPDDGLLPPDFAPREALRVVRLVLDEWDPLRVRAEQALVPLCAEVAQ